MHIKSHDPGRGDRS